jgi:predicted ABC-type ATPase
MIIPQLYVFAGPNGAGKSTLSASMVSPKTTVFDGDIIFQNLKKTYADLEESLLWANVNDVAFAKWKATSLSSNTDAAFETNFRSKEIMKTVELFVTAGFETRLFFMGLDSVEASIDRVKLRVAKGGHNVSVEYININYTKSLENLFSYYNSFTSVHLFQNFSPPGEQVIMTPLMNIHMGQITEVNPTLPEWASSLYSLIKFKSL